MQRNNVVHIFQDIISTKKMFTEIFIYIKG